ncbi:carbohydrate ABC transporter substrate-binding protein [Vibrio cincinnatiensis]|nr:ABC transporter substrate-binding protein [Vibrio cincinnatiensis]MCG3733898.1 carbohydrate ABC transporter substrate-binding protein [Vibrio cincinnatiensis]MCG3741115.1 carbohydrate ABC transporter substrate-binding protein [Vibrio cincinnatiensis]MCG3744677.1 carbohydrate ABC transporter substrate-binding protein [Vibrio cincinnatiensis]
MKLLVPTITKTMIAGAIAFGLPGIATAEVTDGVNQELVKGSITFYTNRTDLVEAGVYRRYEQEFKQRYPNVKEVKVVGFADYQGGLRPRMNTGDYGDLVLILPSVPSEQYGNFYEPLNDLYKEDEVYFYDAWQNDGKVYGISMGNSVEGLVYNKDVLKKAGVEVPIKTLSGFFSAAEKIKANGQIPLYINFGAQWPLQQWDKFPLVVEGSDDVYEKMLTQDKSFSGETAYNKSLSVLKKLIDKGLTERDLMTNSWEDSKNAIAKGDAAMYYLGNWVIPQVIERGAEPDNIGFMPIPSDETGVLKAQMNHDWGYAVSKFSSNKETAKAYLKFLIENSDFEHIAGFIPTLKTKKPSLEQLNEFMSYDPKVIQTPVNSSTFIEVTNRSKIDFYSGGYIQDVITAKDFNEALERLDSRWDRAKKRVMK